MIGKNILWATNQHEHSVAAMLNTDAAWTDGVKEPDNLARAARRS